MPSLYRQLRHRLHKKSATELAPKADKDLDRDASDQDAEDDVRRGWPAFVAEIVVGLGQMTARHATRSPSVSDAVSMLVAPIRIVIKDMYLSPTVIHQISTRQLSSQQKFYCQRHDISAQEI
jgi:hypothetical protein